MTVPSRTKRMVVVLMATMAVYLVLIGQRGLAFVAAGGPVNVVLGLAILVLPFLGVTIIVSEWRFGSATERLAGRLAAEGWAAAEDPMVAELPRRPSGRVDRAAADRLFHAWRAEAEARPDDWRVWFRLATAYDLAGDRSRARATMRHAIALEGDGGTPPR